MISYWHNHHDADDNRAEISYLKYLGDCNSKNRVPCTNYAKEGISPSTVYIDKTTLMIGGVSKAEIPTATVSWWQVLLRTAVWAIANLKVTAANLAVVVGTERVILSLI